MKKFTLFLLLSNMFGYTMGYLTSQLSQNRDSSFCFDDRGIAIIKVEPLHISLITETSSGYQFPVEITLANIREEQKDNIVSCPE